jgi:hypothetical protein
MAAASLARRLNLPGIGVPFFAAFVGVCSGLNVVLLLLLGPLGVALELIVRFTVVLLRPASTH